MLHCSLAACSETGDAVWNQENPLTPASPPRSGGLHLTPVTPVFQSPGMSVKKGKASTSSFTLTPAAPSTGSFELSSCGLPATSFNETVESVLGELEKGSRVCRLQLGKRWEPSYKTLFFSRETRQLIVTKFESSKGRKAAVDIRSLKEVHTLAYKTHHMGIGDKWRRDKEIAAFDHNKVLVILHGNRFILTTWVFAFDYKEHCLRWVQGLQHLMQEVHFTPHPLIIERWLRKEFYSIANPQSLRVSMKHLKPFVQSRLQYKITSKDLQALIKEDDMPYELFTEAYAKLIHVHSLFSDRFTAYSDERVDSRNGLRIRVVEFNNYHRFLVEEQKDRRMRDRGVASEYLRRYLRDVDVSRDIAEPHLTENEFLDYLFSRENSIWDPTYNDVVQDMDQPLCNYWIASSHNTYLTGDQLASESSLDAYSRALLMGCRCIELDCWDGPKRVSGEVDVVIYHGYTMTTKLNLRDVLQTIKEHAFTTSVYPVILSIEDNCGIPAQRVLAAELQEVLGDLLLTSAVDKDETQLPSPNQLRNKIIIKHKKLRQDVIQKFAAEPGSSLDDTWQEQDLMSMPDFRMKGVLYMRNMIDGNWRPHMFVLFDTKLCFTENRGDTDGDDSGLGSTRDDQSQIIDFDDTQDDDVGLEVHGVKPDEMHVTEEWFHGKIKREEAAKLLRQHAPQFGDGLYLVRESMTFIGDFSLSFWYRKEVHHCRIRTKMVDGQKKYFFLEAKAVDTLYELISYYTQNPLSTPRFKATLATPCPQPSPHLGEPWFAGNVNKTRAEEMLNAYREDGAFLIRYSGTDPNVFVLSMRVDGEIWHMRLKRDGRIFLVNQTIFESLCLLVKYYAEHELFRGICLKYPVNEETIEKYSHTDLSYTPEGYYMDISQVEHETILEAIQNYQAKGPNELTFPIGAQIVLVKREKGTMWQGRFGGKTGWFPSSCVRALDDDSNGAQGTDQRDYSTVELAGCTLTKVQVGDRPFAWRINQPSSHHRGISLDIAANSAQEMEDWFNTLVELTKSADQRKNELRGTEKKMNIANELSNLVVYCQAVPFGHADKFYEMCSFNETKLRTLVDKGLIAFNQKHISRVYPTGTRVMSNNFDPRAMWATGCHMVALNYQTPDKPMQLNQGKFLANGRCGYVLKPSYTMSPDFDPEKPETCVGSSPIILTIEIIAGRHLMRRGESRKGGIVSPVVEVEIVGIPADSLSTRTSTKSSDGLHPLWNEPLSFAVHCPEMALLRFHVEDGDFLGPGTDPFIGQAVYPLTCIRTGYRSVILRNTYSEEQELSSLLVHVDVQSAGDGGEDVEEERYVDGPVGGEAVNGIGGERRELEKSFSSASDMLFGEGPGQAIPYSNQLSASSNLHSPSPSLSTKSEDSHIPAKKKSSGSRSKLRNFFKSSKSDKNQ